MLTCAAVDPEADVLASSVRSAETLTTVISGVSLVPVMVMVTVWAGSEVLLA